MPNPTQPMNEEELRHKVQEIIQDFYDTLDNGSGHHSIVYAAKELVKVILADRNAAIREARIEGSNAAARYFGKEKEWKELSIALNALQTQPNAKAKS